MRNLLFSYAGYWKCKLIPPVMWQISGMGCAAHDKEMITDFRRKNF
ncbi:hypothetical protein JOD01_003429 [Brevibacillus fulvus]|uniref:Uncharacterized protein n=1 Tax=Brevibacillus fulvus TaxID=1125967 RepID=A0A938Y559_9BACL|nr:hypothetical protein [Brevibacillus fulvus]